MDIYIVEITLTRVRMELKSLDNPFFALCSFFLNFMQNIGSNMRNMNYE